MTDEEIVESIIQIASSFGISCDDASYIVKSFENFGKEYMMSNIEDDVKVLEKFMNNEMQRDKLERDNRCGGWKIGDIYKLLELNPAINNLLSEREQNIKRIKELEEENKSKEKAYNDCYCEYKHYKQFDSISTQKVKDILNEIQEEYNKLEEQFDCIWDKKSKDNYDRYKLQELSAMQQELGFILGKFEKLLEEGD